MKEENSETICPTCGRANDCLIARDKSSDKKCWCFDVQVNQEKLDKAIKDKAKNQCLCKDCLHKLSV